jgi:urease accessory protein
MTCSSRCRVRPRASVPRRAVQHSPGVEGVLRLLFRERRGTTYLAEQYVRAPFRIVRPFTLEDGSALLQVTHVAPGIMGGDAYRLDVTVEGGARVILLGTSATKLHRMLAGAFARQDVTLTVMPGGALEYYPGLMIPLPQAEFAQTLDVVLAPGAKFGMLEVWAMGRVERGEYLAFRRLSSRTRVLLETQPCYLDALELHPGLAHPAGWGVLEGHRYVASGYWHWADPLQDRDIVRPDVLLVSGVPSCGHLYVRGLARDGLALRTALHVFLGRHRTAWGLVSVPFERYTGILGAGA